MEHVVFVYLEDRKWEWTEMCIAAVICVWDGLCSAEVIFAFVGGWKTRKRLVYHEKIASKSLLSRYPQSALFYIRKQKKENLFHRCVADIDKKMQKLQN